MKESKKVSLKEYYEQQIEETRIDSFSEGYENGSFDTLIRIGALYATYKVSKFLIDTFVCFPAHNKPKDK